MQGEGREQGNPVPTLVCWSGKGEQETRTAAEAVARLSPAAITHRRRAIKAAVGSNEGLIVRVPPGWRKH